MTEQRATVELIAAQLAELLELTEQMRADLKEMHQSMDCIEGHLQRIDALLREAVRRGGGERYGS